MFRPSLNSYDSFLQCLSPSPPLCSCSSSPLLYRTLCWKVGFKNATKMCCKSVEFKKTTGAVPQKCSACLHAAHIWSSHLCYALPVKTLPLHMHFCILVLPRSACTAKFLPKVFLYTASRLTDSALHHCKAVINLLHSLHLPHHI